MNVRAALVSECGVLAALDALHGLSAHWSAAQIQSETEHPAGHVLVAESEGKITGFIIFRAAGGTGEIVDLAVHPDFLRRGTGALLVRRALETMRAENTAQVTLEVHALNLPAQGLYRQQGFGVLGRRKNFYPDADALIMGITL